VRKRKKLIIGALMAAVLLFGSVIGVALADDNSSNPQSPAGFQERLAEKLGITVDELQAKIDEVWAEMPQRGSEGLQWGRRPEGCFGNAFAALDEETQAALKADLVQAQADMQAKVAEIFKSYGIDIDAMKAECADNAGTRIPFQRGPAGCFGNAFTGLDEETQAALKADLAQAQADMQAKVAEIFGSYGIDTEAMKVECAGSADNRLPFQRGFMGPRGMGGRGCFGEPPAPVE
jgi:predicted P-loop ATPase